MLRFWHLASLDAPTVALVWCCAFAWAAHVRLPAWGPILLALVVWSLYIGDRLLDARAGMRTPPLHRLRERHYFHWRHRRILAVLGGLAALAGAAIAATRLPPQARVPDSALAAATLAYFSEVHTRRSQLLARGPFQRPAATGRGYRAALIGIFFTAGCLVPVAWQLPLATSHRPAHWLLAVPACFFAALAWLNCHAIAIWETQSNASKRVQRLACTVSAAGILMAVSLGAADARPAALVLAGAAGALLLALLDQLRGRVTPLALRASADLVLLTPALLLLAEPFRP